MGLVACSGAGVCGHVGDSESGFFFVQFDGNRVTEMHLAQYKLFLSRIEQKTNNKTKTNLEGKLRLILKLYSHS